MGNELYAAYNNRADAFCRVIWSHWVRPDEIISDSDPTFTSLFRPVCLIDPKSALPLL